MLGDCHAQLLTQTPLVLAVEVRAVEGKRLSRRFCSIHRNVGAGKHAANVFCVLWHRGDADAGANAHTDATQLKWFGKILGNDLSDPRRYRRVAFAKNNSKFVTSDPHDDTG